jgi:hypothetical protein
MKLNKEYLAALLEANYSQRELNNIARKCGTPVKKYKKDTALAIADKESLRIWLEKEKGEQLDIHTLYSTLDLFTKAELAQALGISWSERNRALKEDLMRQAWREIHQGRLTIKAEVLL